MEPHFLDEPLVLKIHENQIARYGGGLGLRDRGALASAIAQAQASFGGIYLHPTVFDQAAAYLFHIAQNHPFIDGNKRAGAASALTFMLMNGYRLDPACNEGPFYELTLGVAKGEVTKAQVAEFFRKHTLR